MRKTMLDGANLKSNMAEAVACKSRRYNAHKPIQVYLQHLSTKVIGDQLPNKSNLEENPPPN